MKHLLIKLLIALFVLQLPATPTLAQEDLKFKATGQTVECEIYLRPGLDKIWGSYVCEGNCGGNIVSAKPTFEGRARCQGCGKPNTGEEIRPPKHIKRGGKVYFIAEASLVEPINGSEGVLLNCPFCGAASNNPALSGSCPGCGAEHDVSQVSSAVAPKGAVVTKVGVDPHAEPAQKPSSRRRLKDSASSVAVDAIAKTPGATVSVTLPTRNTGSFLSQVPTPLKALAAGAVTAGAIGFVAWGYDTYSEVGLVTQVVESSHVVVLVDTDSGSLEYKLKIRGDEVVAWRVGEEVEVFYTNFHGAKGAERSNADVYVPQERN